MITPVKKIMNQNLITVPIGTSLFEASELMKEKRIRHLPILDSNEHLVGIISQRDISFIPDSKSIPVERMMTSPVYFVKESTPLRRAIFLMLQEKISCLLIGDENENAIGIITTDDILWHLSHLLADEQKDLTIQPYQVKQTIGEVARELAEMGI